MSIVSTTNSINHQTKSLCTSPLTPRERVGLTSISVVAAIAIGKLATIGSFVVTGVFCCTALPIEAIFAIPVVIGVASAVASFFVTKMIFSKFLETRNTEQARSLSHTPTSRSHVSSRRVPATPTLSKEKKIQNKIDAFLVKFHASFNKIDQNYFNSKEQIMNGKFSEAIKNCEITQDMYDHMKDEITCFSTLMKVLRCAVVNDIDQKVTSLQQCANLPGITYTNYSKFHSGFSDLMKKFVQERLVEKTTTSKKIRESSGPKHKQYFDNSTFHQLVDMVAEEYLNGYSKIYCELEKVSNDLISLSSEIMYIL